MNNSNKIKKSKLWLFLKRKDKPFIKISNSDWRILSDEEIDRRRVHAYEPLLKW